ncbi:MAG: 4-hydroxy-3-methylbut-2-enyl diphosphate reductase [Bacteroidota bacterium]|jgi:4-hydroxy-3-methylbut-2-enyl diphosphate reductase
MKVTVDKNSGFCWGVVRAINFAENELEDSRKLYSLGDIIHNPMEIQRLKDKGLERISHTDLAKVKDAKVLIRAHGEPPETYRLARSLGIELIDATCPVVTRVQERIRKYYNEGYQIVVYGKKEHAEVIGLVGQTDRKAVVIKSLAEIESLDLSRKTVLFSQTTMDKATFYQIKEELERRVKELVVESFEENALDFHAKDTICGQVSGRDRKLRAFAQENDVMIFIAGRNSSNGKVLYHVCQEANPRTYFVETEAEIQPEWFNGVENVGITGATSTPQWLMEQVKAFIEALGNRAAHEVEVEQDLSFSKSHQ